MPEHSAEDFRGAAEGMRLVKQYAQRAHIEDEALAGDVAATGVAAAVEWTDTTWTPIRARRLDTGKVGVHCERVSAACKNCYAAALNRRNLHSHGTGLDFTLPNRELVDIFVDEDVLLQPLRWRRGRKIFVCSQTDLFGEFVADEQIDRVLSIMASASHHTFQILTKRADRMRRYFSEFRQRSRLDGFITRNGVDHDETKRGELIGNPGKWPLPNVWLGVTAENQWWAHKRITALRNTPAAKRFVSLEPMLGPVDIYLVGIDWVICGGEIGPGARPMHPDWARSLRDQCVAAGVPFFFKRRGEYCWDQAEPGSEQQSEATEYVNPDGTRGSGWVLESDSETISNYCGEPPKQNCVWVRRVGKRAAGRLLDGREWSDFPEADNA